MNTRLLTPDDDDVLLSVECLDAGAHAVVRCNADFVADLAAQLLYPSEVARDALASCHVAGYLDEVENGGFSQFVYNSRWDAEVVDRVKTGLAAMGATRHLALFGKGERLVVAQPSRLRSFLEGWYFGADPERDRFDNVTQRFMTINTKEDLTRLNAAWLKSRPNLRVVPQSALPHEVQLRASAITDREARRARALANEPRHLKLIRALCAAAGQTLVRLTGFDPSHEHQGAPAPAWHFLTDQGHHWMVEAGGDALLIDGGSSQQRAAVGTLRFGAD